jgi:magnesium-transporting ATPase (P-type)
VTEDAKQLCIRELAAAEDDAKNLSNKPVAVVSAALTLIVMGLVIALVLFGFEPVFNNVKSQSRGPVSETNSLLEQYGLLSLAFQSILACICWFWLRWKIRDFIWDKMRPGNALDFMRDASGRAINRTIIILCFLFVGAIFLVFGHTVPPVPGH